VALKKSDLYSSLWQSCDELRGGMDASQYKDYILTLLFVKYVTDKAKANPHSLIEIPSGGSFDDMVAVRGDKEIGDKINKIIGKLAEANDLQNVLGLADFNDEEKLGRGKEMQDRLSKLVAIFHDLDFSGSRAQGDDLLGDAYEYLMRQFATESGKSKGQFYTPAEVSRVLSAVVGIGPHTRQDETVYDPACGSGSLLLKAADGAPRGMSMYGQERDNATWALARMNMILHSHEDADIRKGDAITSPQFLDGTALRAFDYAVMNPPFSVKSWSNGLEVEYGRFEFGRPPGKNGDYAFLLHVIKSLKPHGRAAVILPHGVLFRGQAEASIRREILKRGYIRGVIGLPPNLFYGTGIPACIVVLDKQGAGEQRPVFVVDASRGYMKDAAKNRLRSQDIHKIVDVFTKQIDVERYSRLVEYAEIEDSANDSNLNLSRYIDSSEPEDIQDLHAHIRGGIPEGDIDSLESYWGAFPSLRSSLFTSCRPRYDKLIIDIADVESVVFGLPDFRRLRHAARELVNGWFRDHRASLAEIGPETRPKDFIAALGEDLLTRASSLPLLDKYDVYEQLLSYWHDTMHDDVFLVMRDGWTEAARPRAARIVGSDKAGKPKYEDADIKIGTRASTKRFVVDLLPPALIIARFFSAEQGGLQQLAADADAAAAALGEHIEEHAVEEGLLWSAVDEKGKVTQKSAKSALAEAKRAEDAPAVIALIRTLELLKHDADAKAGAKAARELLEKAALQKYDELREEDIKTLLLDDKWLATLETRVAEAVDILTQAFVARIEQLGQRYGATVGELEQEVEELAQRLASHFDAMGVA